ncbi:unnamed protein product [Symbiodinium sp. CCMP2592]|nr:unnamed protein product [Symbiodinium sp. CCMP2592]
MQAPLRIPLSLCRALPIACDHTTPTSCDLWSQLDFALEPCPWTPASLPDMLPFHDDDQPLLGAHRLPFSCGQLRQFLLPQCSLGDGWDILLAISQKDLEQCRALQLRSCDFLSTDTHCFTDGSFDAGVPNPESTCTWACVFISPHSGRCVAVSGLVPTWAFPVDKPSAFIAECYALLIAAWLSVTRFHHSQIVLRSDCTSAIGVFQGIFAGAPDGVAAVLRSLGLFCREFSHFCPRVAHIRGHQGCLGNELADCLARAAAKGRPCGRLEWSPDNSQPWWHQGGSPLGWASVAIARFARNVSYPSPCAEGLQPCRDTLGLEPLQLVAPFLPTPAPPGTSDGQSSWGHFSLRVCSFNVLSLNSQSLEGPAAEGLAFQPARPTLLANSLRDAGIHIAMLQETRTEEGVLHSQGYLRFASGGTRGTLGVEVWILEGHQLFSSNHGPGRVRLTREACVVAHRDPRRLLLLFKQDGFSLLIVSAHAPHRACEVSAIDEWWKETHRLCVRHAQSSPILFGGDMNASVGSVPTAAIGDHDPDQQDESGAMLASFLAAQQLWLPCTFSFCHSGPSGTYMQKRNGAMSRIDFIACPDAWKSGNISTWTDSTLHAGQTSIDHVATCCQLDLPLNLSGKPGHRSKRRFDGRAMLTPKGREAVEGILQHAPQIPWSANPHAHAATLVSYLQDALATAFPLQPGRRHRPYLSDSTWALHSEVARLRKSCTRIKCALNFHFLAAAFQAWAGADGRILMRMLDSAWTREAHRAGAQQSHHLGEASRRLKAACKQDRATYFSELADEVQRDAPHASKAVHRLMGLRRRKPFRPEVLPMLQKADGSLCRTPDEVVHRWREHFRDQEDGFEASPHELAVLPVAEAGPVGPPLLSDMPSPDVLLQVIASSQKGKAAGPDGLPAEVGHASPQALVRLLMPLLVKIGFTCEEPIGFKGGTLSRLYKGKGDTSQCASYRAIMLLPTLAKFLHKAFRPGLYEVFRSNAAPAQLGGLKATSVVLGSHLTRAFTRFCACAGKTSIVLFTDVASAYYSAVRALTARKTPDPVGSPPSCPDRDHLAEALRQPSAMAQAQAPPWVEALTAELNSNTWMCLAGDHQPIVTRQGSRPGSSFADLFFGVTIPRMLRWRDDARSCPAASHPHIEHTPEIWWDGLCDFSPPSADPSAWRVSTRLSDVIWADDLAKCIIAPEANNAAFAAAFECGLLADAFYAHGYELSFGPTKTAAIIVPRGPGARKTRRALFSSKPVLPVLREEQGAAELPLVTSYRHLGVKITSAVSLIAELRHRASQAWAAYQQGCTRARVFRSGRIALKRRGLLLSTHVMTRLLFASGAWPALSKGEHAFFFRTVIALYRHTLAIPHGGDQHLSHATICALIGQPPPEVLLLTERARYILQLVNAAPAPLWALIRRDPPYVAHVREALLWVYRWVCATSPLGDPESTWPEWELMLKQRPHVFKALIKRACHAVLPFQVVPLGPAMRPVGVSTPILGGLKGTSGHRPSAGDWDHFSLELDPAFAHPGLLADLRALDSPTQELVWGQVVEYIEPLDVLRNTLDEWQKSPGPFQDTDFVATLAADVRLLLDPELLCDDFRAPKHPPMPAVACPPLPTAGPGKIGFVLTGHVCTVTISDPPLRDFVYPFRASVPLAAARRQADWLEAACDSVGAALQQSTSHPVAFRLSSLASECLAPVPEWLLSCGFRVESGYIRSPLD